MDTKFLTVMAVLDENAQRILGEWQGRVLAAGLAGTQTMGIPFHISLGSYPPDREAELIRVIAATAAGHGAFSLAFSALDSFPNSRVLFARPEASAQLSALRGIFCHDYPNSYPWVPHATLFCGEPAAVRAAREILTSRFRPFRARVIALEMGEFFPPRRICREELLP